MEIVIEKIGKVVEKMYIMELLGVYLYENMPEDIITEIEELRQTAIEFEIMGLRNAPDYPNMKKKVGNIINKLDDRLKSEKNYKKSQYLLDIF